MRTKLWPLRDHNGVKVHDAQVTFCKQAPHVLEEAKAVRIFPLRIGIRKMRANITEASRPQKRIADSVCQRVSIRVPDRALFERDLDAAKNKLAASGEPVQIITDTGSAHRPTSAAIRSRLK